MIVDEAGLAAAAEVIGIGRAEAAQVDAIVMSAFGNPGAAELRKAVRVPVVGIREPAMRAAAAHGASFGIATTAPGLVRSIETGVHDLGLEDRFSGVRVPEGDPLALAEAAIACFEQNGAQTVVIGGGPPSAAAARFRYRIVEPVPTAIRVLLDQLARSGG